MYTFFMIGHFINHALIDFCVLAKVSLKVQRSRSPQFSKAKTQQACPYCERKLASLNPEQKDDIRGELSIQNVD